MSIISNELKKKILTMTGTFETSLPPPGCFGAVTGNFDGQGLSWGCLQWNLGQGTLQPLLLKLGASDERDPSVLKRLGMSPEGQRVQLEAAEHYFTRGLRLASTLKLVSERGLAFCFDVCVQNGNFDTHFIPKVGPEWSRLKEAAIVVSERCNPKWKQDVLARKLCIAVGMGEVHGRQYDLEKDFGISMKPYNA